MTIVVEPVDSVRRYRRGRGTMEQRFHFRGEDVDAAAITEVLFTAPLVGAGSVFGRRPGHDGARTGNSRTLGDFSPAPGIRFDVEFLQQVGSVVVRLSQPDRKVPYLQGDLVWFLDDEADGAVLDEQINTERALEAGGEPLGGPRPSLRRWMFFRLGHKRVMIGAMATIADLLNRRSS